MTSKKQKETIRALWGKLSFALIGMKTGQSATAVRKMGRRMGLEPIKPQNSNLMTPEKLEHQFVAFLSKARTKKEIVEHFGDSKLLNRKYLGLVKYKTRNEFNEIVYVLLPEMVDNFHLKDKVWTYHVCSGEESVKEPYVMVQLPNFKGKIIIAPLFDVHYGHFAHRKEKFMSYLNWIARTPNVYTVLGGDLMENALDDGRGMTYDSDKNPQTQFNDIVKMLAPIAHKILVATPGNHERRTEKKTGIDITELLCDKLKIPYFTGPVFMDVSANGYRWSFYIEHGNSFSKTKGGKMNAASRPKSFTGVVNFYLSGHVHDVVVQPELILVQDPVHCRLRRVTQWIVIAQSFLGWYNTYAYKAGWTPPAPGGVAIELDDNGKYRASFS